MSINGSMHRPVLASRMEETPAPAVFSLAQHYPNPFHPITEIRYDLPGSSHESAGVDTKVPTLI